MQAFGNYIFVGVFLSLKLIPILWHKKVRVRIAGSIHTFMLLFHSLFLQIFEAHYGENDDICLYSSLSHTA